MDAKNPDYNAHMRTIFEKGQFIHEIGLKLVDFGSGWVETRIDILPKHSQQDNIVHAGVLATMADHSAGGAAGTLLKAGQLVLSVEFKINMLRPARGDYLRCRAEVLKPGRTLTIAESEIYAVTGDESKMVAKATVTLANLDEFKLGQKS
jgi:uncharacterized protein (TIGR00369 family)